MRDVSQIDWAEPMSKIVEGDQKKVTKQRIFYQQNGIDYDAAGIAVDPKQVKAYYQSVADEAAAEAKAASDAAAAAAENAAALKKHATSVKVPRAKAASK